MSELSELEILNDTIELDNELDHIPSLTFVEDKYKDFDKSLKYRTTAFVGNNYTWGNLSFSELMEDLPTPDGECYSIDGDLWPSIFELLGLPVSSDVGEDNLADLEDTKFFQACQSLLEIHDEPGVDVTLVASNFDCLDKEAVHRNDMVFYPSYITNLIKDLMDDYDKFISSKSRSKVAFWKKLIDVENAALLCAPANVFMDATVVFLFNNGVFVNRLTYLYIFKAFSYVYLKVLSDLKDPLIVKKGKITPPFNDIESGYKLNSFFMPVLKREYAKISELQDNLQTFSDTLDELLQDPFAIYIDKNLAICKEGRIMVELFVRMTHLVQMLEMHINILDQLMTNTLLLSSITQDSRLSDLDFVKSLFKSWMLGSGAGLMQCNPHDFAALKSIFYDLVDTKDQIMLELNQAKHQYPEFLDTLDNYATLQERKLLQQLSNCLNLLVYPYRNILGFNLELFDVLIHPVCPWRDYYKLLQDEWLKDPAASSSVQLFENGVSVKDHLVVVNVLSNISAYIPMNYHNLNFEPHTLSQTLSFNASFTNFSYHNIKCRICENNSLPAYLRYGFLTFNPSLNQGVFLVGSEELKLYKQDLTGISLNFDALSDKHKELMISNPILAALTQRELPFKFNALYKISTSKLVWNRAIGTFNEQMSLFKTSSLSIPVYFDISNISINYGYLLDSQRGIGFPVFISDPKDYCKLHFSFEKTSYFFEYDQAYAFDYSYANDYPSKWQKGWRQPKLDKESQTVVFRDLEFKLVKPMSMYDAIRMGIDQNTGQYVIVANSVLLENKQRFYKLVESLRYADVSLRKQRCRFILQNCKSLFEQLQTKKTDWQEQFKQLDKEQVEQLVELYLKNKKLSILEKQLDKLEKIMQFMEERENKLAAENRKDEEESSSVAWQGIVDRALELQTLIQQGLEKMQAL